MAITNTKVYDKHLDKRLEGIWFDEYTEFPSLFDKIAHISQAPPGGDDREAELSDLGQFMELPEGTPIAFDSPVEGNEVNRTPTKYGLGIQITEEMVSDDVHSNMTVEKMVAKLAQSAAYKRETAFWDLFNNGFATHQSWDSQYIFSTSHTGLKSGASTANRPSTDAALSETSLQAAFEYYDGVDSEAGNPKLLSPNLLVVPIQLRWLANKLAKSLGAVGTADNDINTLNPSHGVVDGWRILVSRHLTSTTAWFLLSDEHDFRFRWKYMPRFETADDFSTGNALAKGTMRFSTYCNRYKGAYGTTGA